MNSNMNFVADNQSAYGDALTETDAEAFPQSFQNPQTLVPKYRDTTEYRHEWSDGSEIGCDDCPDDECTGHCTSCRYRPV